MTDSPLQIDTVEWYVVKVPTPYRYSGSDEAEHLPGTDYFFDHPWDQVYSTKIETTLVKVIGANGRHGWGEIQAPVVPEVTATLVHELLGPMLLGENAFETERLRDRMYRSNNVRGHVQGFMLDAISGLDIALWDLVGRERGRSVAAMLGGKRRDKLPAYVSLPGATPTEQAPQAREFVDRGFTGVKTFAGRGVTQDVATVDAILEAVDDETDVYVDGFWAYTPHEAITLGRKFAVRDVAFFEAPLQPEEVEGHARVAAAVDLPVAVGEPFRTAREFRRWITHDALDVAQPDVVRLGLTESERVRNAVTRVDRPIAPHTGSGLGVGIAATWQYASALDTLLVQEFQPRCVETTNEFLKPTLDHESGKLIVPSGPGLGIEVDEPSLAEYVVDSGRREKRTS